MTDQDKKDFSIIMLGVAENYGQTLTANGIALRFEMLKAYPLSEVRAAAVSILQSRKYTSMPTVADFLEHISGGSAEDKSETEAGKVLEAIERHGRYYSVVFDEPVTQAVIMQAYGGWPQLCADCGVEESEHWFRKGFAKTWAAYSRQGIKHFGHIPGLTELTNNQNGHSEWTDQPKLVGNVQKALTVLEGGRLAEIEQLPQVALPGGQEFLSRLEGKRVVQ